MLVTFVKIFVLEVVLLLTCLLGDHHLQHPVARQQFVVAMVDNLTHGMIAGVSWAIVCDIKVVGSNVLQCAWCMILAMGVDLDHFLAAGSFSLKVAHFCWIAGVILAATSLPYRSPFHATSVLVLIDAALLFLSAFATTNRTKVIQLATMMITVAWLSHHVRDATRRGLWFYPFGSTRPCSKTLYIGIILVLPLIMKGAYHFYKKEIPSSITAADHNAFTV